jgi:signal transduction histidine kinase
MSFENDISAIKKLAENRSLLFVEDDDIQRNTYVRIFQQLFDNVTVAINGQEGLEAYKTVPFDLVITDLSMPKMNGIEMLREINKINPYQFSLITTAHNEIEYLHEAIECGVSGFLLKPLSSDKLMDTLHKILIKIAHAEEDRKHYVDLKYELLRNMKHEIKTPLNAILGFGSILEKKMHGSNMKCDYIEIINDSAKAIEVMIDRLMRFSQLSSDAYTLNHQLSVIGPEVRGVCDEYKKIIESKNIDLTLDIDPRLEAPLKIDYEDIDIILHELLTNAIKFTPGSGTIALKVLLNDDASRLLIDIEDNGLGILPEVGEKIYDPFYQSDGSLTRVAEGIGIGLAIVKSMVSLMRGTITYESVPDVRTAFHIDLPLPDA